MDKETVSWYGEQCLALKRQATIEQVVRNLPVLFTMIKFYGVDSSNAKSVVNCNLENYRAEFRRVMAKENSISHWGFFDGCN